MLFYTIYRYITNNNIYNKKRIFLYIDKDKLFIKSSFKKIFFDTKLVIRVTSDMRVFDGNRGFETILLVMQNIDSKF